MGIAKSEAELAERTARFLKAELKRTNVTYEELAERFRKLKHGTFPATFLISVMADIESDSIILSDV